MKLLALLQKRMARQAIAFLESIEQVITFQDAVAGMKLLALLQKRMARQAKNGSCYHI